MDGADRAALSGVNERMRWNGAAQLRQEEYVWIETFLFETRWAMKEQKARSYIAQPWNPVLQVQLEDTWTVRMQAQRNPQSRRHYPAADRHVCHFPLILAPHKTANL